MLWYLPVCYHSPSFSCLKVLRYLSNGWALGLRYVFNDMWCKPLKRQGYTMLSFVNLSLKDIVCQFLLMWKGNIRTPFLSCWCVGLFLFFVLHSFSVLVILKVPDWLPSSLVSPISPKNRKGKIREAADLVMSGSSILAWATLEEYFPKYKGEDCSLWIQSAFTTEKTKPVCQHHVTAGAWGPVVPATHSLFRKTRMFFSLSSPAVKVPSRLGLNTSFSPKLPLRLLACEHLSTFP